MRSILAHIAYVTISLLIIALTAPNVFKKGRKKMKFYRFELMFCDDPQDVGLFQGLSDATPDKADSLLNKLFSSLAIPVIDTKTHPAVSSWFTPDGLQKFSPAIETVIQYLQDVGWDVCAAVIEADPNYAVYTDKNQAVFDRDYLNGRYMLSRIDNIDDVNRLPADKS